MRAGVCDDFVLHKIHEIQLGLCTEIFSNVMKIIKNTCVKLLTKQKLIKIKGPYCDKLYSFIEN